MSADQSPADGTVVVWFRRDLRVRDQAMFLTAADAARRGLALFVLDPALLGPSGAPRRTVLYRCLRSLDESLDGRLLVVRGDPADVVPRGRGRRRRAAGARRGRLRPVRAHPGRGRREGARRRRPRARPHGLALRRRARPGHQARRHALPGVHPVQPRLAAPRLARARRHRRRHRRVDRPRRQARRPATGARSRTTTACRRPAARRRGRRAARWQEFLDDDVRGYKRTPRPPRQAGHLAHVGAPQVRRGAPAHAAGRPRRAHR